MKFCVCQDPCECVINSVIHFDSVDDALHFRGTNFDFIDFDEENLMGMEVSSRGRPSTKVERGQRSRRAKRAS